MCMYVYTVVDLSVGVHRRLCVCACLCVGLLLITAVHSLPMIPYSGNLSREKTFANFAVFEYPRKFYPRNFWGGYCSGFS